MNHKNSYDSDSQGVYLDLPVGWPPPPVWSRGRLTDPPVGGLLTQRRFHSVWKLSPGGFLNDASRTPEGPDSTTAYPLGAKSVVVIAPRQDSVHGWVSEPDVRTPEGPDGTTAYPSGPSPDCTASSDFCPVMSAVLGISAFGLQGNGFAIIANE